MTHVQHTLNIATGGQGLYEFSDDVRAWTDQQGVDCGLLTVFCTHTSASLTIQENADPDVCRDLETFFCKLVSDDASLYRHTNEGRDDMPAHIRSALGDVSLSVPVMAGRLTLGTWQGIFLFEHRTAPHRRQVILHLNGE